MKQLNYEEIPIGKSFIYNNLKFTKLDNGKAIINTINNDYGYCFFDNVNNVYDKSIIRHYINGKYLDLMRINRDDLLPIYKKDLVTLLTECEYLLNKHLIKKLDYQWWLRDDDGYGREIYAVNVTSFGGTWVNYVRYDCAVRIVVKFKPNTIMYI